MRALLSHQQPTTPPRIVVGPVRSRPTILPLKRRCILLAARRTRPRPDPRFHPTYTSLLDLALATPSAIHDAPGARADRSVIPLVHTHLHTDPSVPLATGRRFATSGS